jgi:hypothetical protein
VGIEPTHKGFADLSLTAWVPRLNGFSSDSRPIDGNRRDRLRALQGRYECQPRTTLKHRCGDWSGRRDLNPRPSPWQGDALPLSYSRNGTHRV